jgi:dihydroorotate dehydrogenase (fumarate)
MKLATTYLGLKLRNPIVVGASPFCDNLTTVCRLEEAGAAAIVMHSLFEEQINLEQRALHHHTESIAESSPEATSYFPQYDEFQLSPDHYVRQLGRLKAAVTIPVIASLNGTHLGGWTAYAKLLEDAGADALELNLYQLATDPDIPGEQIEREIVEVVRSVMGSVRIPVAVKLSPFHSALPHFARNLDRLGVGGLVLFNRFYQPDFNIEELEVSPQLKLSDPGDLLMRLRWLAIISPHVHASLAASGGVHTAPDAIKAMLAGAHAVQVVSALLKKGPSVIPLILSGLEAWMTEYGYTRIDEFRGALNHARCPDPASFERANYIRILQSWKI